MNMREAFANTMVEVGTEDPKLVVLVGDISHGILQTFAKACPGRFFNIGILEPTIVSMSAGIAHSGLYPVAHTIAPFLTERSLEQIKLEFGYQQLGGTLISVGSAFDYSQLGCSHHCYTDLGIIKSIPNTEVVFPAMPNEFNLLFKQTYHNGKLTYFRIPKEVHSIKIPDEKITMGRGITIKEGNDITILVIGPQLKAVMNAVDEIGKNGINCEVLYYPVIKPFDVDLVANSVQKTKRILVIEEHSVYGGINEDVLRATCNIGHVQYEFINIPDEFSRGYGEYSEHCERLGFTIDNISNKINKLFSNK